MSTGTRPKSEPRLRSLVRIVRGRRQQASRTQTFEVPYEPGDSVLDALIWIREHLDASLAFRYSCISANVCKECVMSIDGQIQYACLARLTSGPIEVAPLPNKARVRDLVCETVPPKERIA